MSRDIPPEVPDEIAFIIRDRWGDMKSMAEKTGIKYDTIRSVLYLSDRRIIRTLKTLAEPLGISPDKLAEVLIIRDVKRRKILLSALLDGKSVNRWSKEAGVTQRCAQYLATNLDNAQIEHVKSVSEALGISLEVLGDAYTNIPLLTA